MALVNVAVGLAQAGRRVLAVDFDLEAPGLDTFSLLRPSKPNPGLVDFVRRYLDTDQAPDVRDFVAKSPVLDNLFVMPSGVEGKEYATTFSQIDWSALYDRRDGYLLFEDLKEQWRYQFEPDYVLIDSRTGYTDTSGICTRQLPDSVVVLFFPNEQNLRGLNKTVADIRSEAEPQREKNIQLHFVMSNVPDLDDEDDILIRMKTRFQEELGFSEEPLVVHHYDSLSLLNQMVFAQERPESRLTKEYREIGNKVVRGNLADRDGALYHIRDLLNGLELQRSGEGVSTANILTTAKKIEESHAEDGEVLFRLGVMAVRYGLEEAESYLDKAINQGYRDARAFVERGRARAERGDAEGASQDANVALGFDSLPVHLVRQAMRLLRQSEANDPERWPAVAALDPDEQLSLARTLERGNYPIRSTAIVKGLLEETDQSEETLAQARTELAMYYIGSGKFEAAVELLSHGELIIDQMEIRDAFNYAMAIWGSAGIAKRDPFVRVVELDKNSSDERHGANYMQCMAIAYWATGDVESAAQFACLARESSQSGVVMFSCWRYRTVRVVDFLEDIEEILNLIQGDHEQFPKYLAEAQASTTSC